MLEVRLLGQFEVQLRGAVINIASRAEQSLLAHLILNAGTAFRREYLAGLFWPDSDETNAKGYLRQALWRLRKAFAESGPDVPNYFLADKITLAFDPRHHYWLDVTVLEEERGEMPDDLLAATQVYIGELLPGFYEDWVVLERERLRALFERKMQRLLEQLQSARRWRELLQHAERWISLGDIPEPAYRGLILGYAAQGEMASALAAYNRLAQDLERELGVAPSPETTLLAEEVRSGKSFAQADPGRNIRFLHNLPAQSTHFIGRENKLAEIDALLANPACRLLSLVGPGGIGKSRLALKAAENWIGSYLHGVYLVSLAGIESSKVLPSTILTALDLEPSSETNPKQQLFNYLQGKEMLLVLDNFEHLLNGTDLLTDILLHIPRVTLLVTSRERLNLQSEWVFPIEGLPFPDTDQAAGVEQNSAVALFKQTAQRVRANFMLDETNKPFVARICRLVQGMPLAIELAAAWAPVLEPEKIANKVEESLDILVTDLHDLPERQRSMRAVFDASWKMLTAEEQASIQKLSVFRGGFKLSVVEKAFRISQNVFLALVHKCWVQGEAGDRFHLHELIRQYAFEWLQTDQGLWKSANENHSAYYCRFLKEREREWHGPRHKEIFLEIEADIHNFEAGWKWALDQSRLDLIGQALESLCNYYERSYRLRDGEAASRTAVDHLDKSNRLGGTVATDASILQVRALTWQGVFSEDHRTAVQLFKRASELMDRNEADGHDARPDKAHLLIAEGAAIFWSDPRRALQLNKQGAALYEALGDEARLAEALIDIGSSAWALGDLDQALRLAQRSLSIHQKAENLHSIGDTTDLLSKIFREKGQLGEAEQSHRESIAIARKLGSHYREAVYLLNLAHTLICAGKFAEAQARTQESSLLSQEAGHTIPYTSYILARALLYQGNYAQARIRATWGLEETRKINDDLKGLFLNCLGEIDLAENRLTEALERFQESLDATQESHQNILIGMPLANLGYTARALNRPDQARQYLRQCLKDAIRIESFRLAIHALPAMALLETDQGNVEQAIELYALASKYPYVGSSKWFEDIAGLPIASLAAALPPETVVSAQTQGASLELWEVVKRWMV